MSLGKHHRERLTTPLAASGLQVPLHYLGHAHPQDLHLFCDYLSAASNKSGLRHFCLSFFPMPSVVAGTTHAVKLIIWQTIKWCVISVKSVQRTAFILRNTSIVEESKVLGGMDGRPL